MKKDFISFLMLLILGLGGTQLLAQSTSTSLTAQPVPDRTVFYNLSDTGVAKPILWGLDLAWLSEANVQRGIAFMGKDNVDVIRSSFETSVALNGEQLQGDALSKTNTRINIIKNNLNPDVEINLNCDHPSVDASFIGNATNWAKLIEITAKMHQDEGLNVTSVSPFNEPDYGWAQYTGTETDGMSDFYDICVKLRSNAFFDGMRICGGNTLNCDRALPWYNYLKDVLDEGNTHQLAGSFDSYASFFEAVRSNGDHATADELHNVMEAMVGVEYGMQTGIWWGTAERARGEFCIASDGKRLGYAEHRPNWTAASVYRGPEGKVQAFGGTSERQAATTTYRFVSKDRAVYYNGYGPQHEYTMELPGGTGYQQGQTNAETVVDITWGEDIQPAIDGRYVLVNRKSKKVMEVESNSITAGANIRQNRYKSITSQQWDVEPVDTRIGGDFSYFKITNVNSSMVPDVLNWSLANGANILQYGDGNGANQQWYLEYAEDGWFFIRNRHSAYCLEVVNSSTTAGANIQQWAKDGAPNQQWRFIPVGAAIEFEPPRAPANLSATANAASVKLTWDANTEDDLAGYNVYRSESSDGEYNTIGRNIDATSFVDNTVVSGVNYFYKLKAVDQSLNSSDYSLNTSAASTGENTLIARLQFEENTLDSSENLNHASAYDAISYTAGEVGSKAIVLDGESNFVQLPVNVANSNEITVATWVYWNKASSWQRVFDFGNSQEEYMFFTPTSGSGKMRFAIKNGGDEQSIDGSSILPFRTWVHVAVTLDDSGAKIYVNGELEAESSAITIRPDEFKPMFNYIGRSQWPDPLFNGNIDDFRVYNYALSGEDIVKLIENPASVEEAGSYIENEMSVWPVPASDVLHVNYFTADNSLSLISVLDLNGKELKRKEVEKLYQADINVSDLSSGIYLLRLTTGNTSVVKKFIVKH